MVCGIEGVAYPRILLVVSWVVFLLDIGSLDCM
jgi:hypothetical protein